MGEKLRYLRSDLSTWKNQLKALITTSLKNTGNFTLFATSWEDSFLQLLSGYSVSVEYAASIYFLSPDQSFPLSPP